MMSSGFYTHVVINNVISDEPSVLKLFRFDFELVDELMTKVPYFK